MSVAVSFYFQKLAHCVWQCHGVGDVHKIFGLFAKFEVIRKPKVAIVYGR